MIVKDYELLNKVKNPQVCTDIWINRGEGKALSYRKIPTNKHRRNDRIGSPTTIPKTDSGKNHQ